MALCPYDLIRHNALWSRSGGWRPRGRSLSCAWWRPEMPDVILFLQLRQLTGGPAMTRLLIPLWFRESQIQILGSQQRRSPSSCLEQDRIQGKPPRVILLSEVMMLISLSQLYWKNPSHRGCSMDQRITKLPLPWGIYKYHSRVSPGRMSRCLQARLVEGILYQCFAVWLERCPTETMPRMSWLSNLSLSFASHIYPQIFLLKDMAFDVENSSPGYWDQIMAMKDIYLDSKKIMSLPRMLMGSRDASLDPYSWEPGIGLIRISGVWRVRQPMTGRIWNPRIQIWESRLHSVPWYLRNRTLEVSRRSDTLALQRRHLAALSACQSLSPPSSPRRRRERRANSKTSDRSMTG